METIQSLTRIDFQYVFISVLTILAAIKAIISLFEWTFNKFGLETKSMRKRHEDHELLINTVEGLKSLSDRYEEDFNKIYENNIEYRNKSVEIRDDLKNSIQVISSKLDEIKKSTEERFLNYEKKHNKRIRAELKDKIGQSYRYYHAKGEINDIELEALQDLISEYEAALGENSFVHSLVQKEMYTWEKVERK